LVGRPADDSLHGQAPGGRVSLRHLPGHPTNTGAKRNQDDGPPACPLARLPASTQVHMCPAHSVALDAERSAGYISEHTEPMTPSSLPKPNTCPSPISPPTFARFSPTSPPPTRYTPCRTRPFPSSSSRLRLASLVRWAWNSVDPGHWSGRASFGMPC
jgi:hypothetical protein